jgi:periplasmic glucans biosynthesis protein
MIDRRAFLAGSFVMWFTGHRALAAQTLVDHLGTETPFSFEMLKGWAEAHARSTFEPAMPTCGDSLDRIGYDEHREIKFRPELAIWRDGGGPYPVEMFQLGRYFKSPIRIFVVSEGGYAREVLYSPDFFTYGDNSLAKSIAQDAGFAGFRVLTGSGEADWLSYLGASYFRSPGETLQYGLSARGLAINVAMPAPEEFPHFTKFWLEPLAGGRSLAVNALLDSPSIAGAFRMEAIRREGAFMSIQAHLFPRVDIERVGIAPLTSMFWHGKHNRGVALDWRPEVHDSNGLALWTGLGERIWRPLNNPSAVQTSSFYDVNPKGFGLLQRERRFDRYQDDGVFYDRRPSLWVEPVGNWGEGAIQLVEIPTNDEVHDNIVAYWTPKKPYRAGEHYQLSYNLHWRTSEPYPAPVASVVATRIGKAGLQGGKRTDRAIKYVVDFRGGRLKQFFHGGEVEVVVTAASGTVEHAAAYRVGGTDIWRAIFDFRSTSPNPTDIRLYLRKGDDALSETWLFQHVPSLDSL